MSAFITDTEFAQLHNEALAKVTARREAFRAKLAQTTDRGERDALIIAEIRARGSRDRHISRCPVCGDLFGHSRNDARCCSHDCRNAWRNRCAELGEIILAEWPEYARAGKSVTPDIREIIALSIRMLRLRLGDAP